MTAPQPTPTTFTRLVDTIQYIVGVAAATAVVLLFSLGGHGAGSDPTASDHAGAETTASDPTVTDAVVSSPQEIALGRSIYAEDCAICHGPTGAGGTGPALDAGLLDKYPDPQAQQVVVAIGRNAMIGFGDRLTADEIAAVVAFTRVALGLGEP